MKHSFPIVLICFAIQSGFADAFLLQNNSVISGKWIEETANAIVVERFDRPITYSRASVREIFRDGSTNDVAALQIPRLGQVLTRLVKEPWAHDVRQIPATVIATGSLRNVPYLSFRCGIDYEANVYGDPQNPACVEIGIYRSLLSSEVAKSNCLAFLRGVLGEEHAQFLFALNRSGETKSLSNIVFEVTPPTASDSYGGWWISIYDEAKLEAARASAAEIQQITVTRTEAERINKLNADSGWRAEELRRARTATLATDSAPERSGGSVYVRGYYRKDGSYVQPYSRSAPRR